MAVGWLPKAKRHVSVLKTINGVTRLRPGTITNVPSGTNVDVRITHTGTVYTNVVRGDGLNQYRPR